MSDFSELLWGEKFPEKRLRLIRQQRVDQGFPEGYAQEYLNNPIDEENAYFRKQDFLPISEDFRQEVAEGKKFLEYIIGGDLAISEKDTAAYTVFPVIGLDEEGKWKVVDIRRFRGDTFQIIETMFELNKRYRPQMFVLEQENIARSIGPVLNKMMLERNEIIPIEPTIPSGDKVKRARSLQQRMRAGFVEFDTEAEWFPALRQEMLYFPRGSYVDQVDAMANIALVLDKQIPAPTLKEIEDEEYEDEMSTSLYSYEGRDSMTGY